MSFTGFDLEVVLDVVVAEAIVGNGRIGREDGNEEVRCGKIRFCCSPLDGEAASGEDTVGRDIAIVAVGRCEQR